MVAILDKAPIASIIIGSPVLDLANRSDMWKQSLALALILLVAGCAAPSPVLYPNDRLRVVGQAQAEQDIAECQALAEASGAGAADKAENTVGSTAVGAGVGAASGAVGGAIVDSVGTGTVVGAATGATAGLLRGLLTPAPPSQAYMRFVERCLMDRGYDPVGWQ